MRRNPETHFDPASWLQGREHAALSARVSALEAWRTGLEGYTEIARIYLRRLLLLVVIWGLAIVTACLPGTPAARLATAIRGLLISG
jgi:hypothetical protein